MLWNRRTHTKLKDFLSGLDTKVGENQHKGYGLILRKEVPGRPGQIMLPCNKHLEF